jgi:citrate lyase subunit beta / citryl-CoA lyase
MRSLMFVPAGSPKMLEKSVSSAADVVILDLEDAVQTTAKDEARDLLVRHLGGRPASGPKVAIRINDLSTRWAAADLAAVLPLKPDLVMLPKTEGPADLARLDALMARHEAEPGRTGLLVVATETVGSTLSLAAEPWRHPRLRGMLWGGEDLAAELGATANRDPQGRYTSPFRLARDLCLMAARRAGVLAIDAVYTDLGNSAGLEAEAEAARRDGFDAKAAIHPAQVEVINRVFRSSPEDIRWAEEVLAALARSSTGIATVDGQMIDAPHAARARRILDRARPD